MEAKEFKIRPGAFPELKKRMIKIILPIYVLLSAIIVYTSYYKDVESGTSWIFLLIPMVFFTGIVGLGVFRSIQRQKQMMQSYRISIDANSIYRDQQGLPTIHIYKSEVLALQRFGKNAFVIKTKNV